MKQEQLSEKIRYFLLYQVGAKYYIINELFLKLITLSPFVQDGYANQRKWDVRLEQVFAELKNSELAEMQTTKR